MPVFLEGSARWLLIVHALAGMALLGATTHLAIGAIQLRRGRPSALRLVRSHAVIAAGLLATAMIIGLLMYPHYRVHVRGVVLDRSAPWASNLFDIKENFAALALPLAVCTFVLGRRAELSGSLQRLLVFCSVALWALVAFSAVAGLVVTSVKGV